MGNDSLLFLSTPLWFYQDDYQQEGNLEEHLIGVPASSIMALIPKMNSISNPLIGGFVYGKDSPNYIDFFEPTADKKFSYEMGLNILKCLKVPTQPDVVYKTCF